VRHATDKNLPLKAASKHPTQPRESRFFLAGGFATWRLSVKSYARTYSMADALAPSALKRWRRDPAAFIVEAMRNPETGKPFVLLPAEVAFLDHAWPLTSGNAKTFK
jgi:hypothetical protein